METKSSPAVSPPPSTPPYTIPATSPLCPYGKIFGKPGEGIHKHRIFGLASVDLFATLLLAVIIGLWKKWSIFKIVGLFIALVIISVPIHRIFCVETTLTKKILNWRNN